MYSSKAKVVSNRIIRTVQMVIGICSAAFGIIGLLLYLKAIDSTTIVMVTFFVVIGGLLIYFSIQRSILDKAIKSYEPILSHDKTGSIENLASILGTSQDVVKKNLERLIYKKFFLNAFIDEERNRVVFNLTSNMQHGDIQESADIHNTEIQQNTETQQETEISKGSNQATIEYMPITCKNCGGIGKIQKGTVYECEYCGAHIQ